MCFGVCSSKQSHPPMSTAIPSMPVPLWFPQLMSLASQRRPEFGFHICENLCVNPKQSFLKNKDIGMLSFQMGPGGPFSHSSSVNPKPMPHWGCLPAPLRPPPPPWPTCFPAHLWAQGWASRPRPPLRIYSGPVSSTSSKDCDMSRLFLFLHLQSSATYFPFWSLIT